MVEYPSRIRFLLARIESSLADLEYRNECGFVFESGSESELDSAPGWDDKKYELLKLIEDFVNSE